MIQNKQILIRKSFLLNRVDSTIGIVISQTQKPFS